MQMQIIDWSCATPVAETIGAAWYLWRNLQAPVACSTRRSIRHYAAFASIRCAINVSAICTAFSAAPLRR
ncbi:MAG TPA: hypothetical protein VIH15_05355, partial [Casimicrobiaceae bacterium]